MQDKQGFEQDGYSFALTDMLVEGNARVSVQSAYGDSDGKQQKQRFDRNPSSVGRNQVCHRTEDGFTGTLHLNTDSIKVEPAGYRKNSWTVSATRTYPNLSDMDLEFIPKTTTENGRTLQFANVQWQTDNTENVG